MAGPKSRKKKQSDRRDDGTAEPVKFQASPRKPNFALTIISVALFVTWCVFLAYVAFFSGGS